MPPEDRPLAGRRALLGAALGGGLVGLCGCGIRLEDDAPAVPLLPARTPVPAEELLTALTLDCGRLAALAQALPGPLAARLATLHRRQQTVLRTTLLGDGVPDTSLAPSADASPSSGPTSSPVPRPEGSRAALGEAEAEAAAGADRFARVTAPLRAPVAALHAQRWAAARLLGVPAPGPVAATVTPPVAEDVAAEVAGGVYLVEVAAARASAADRARSVRTRAALLDLRSEVLTGHGPEPRAVGHPLPFPVRTEADARRLAREAVSTLRTALGSHLTDLVDDGPTGCVAATRWLGAVEVEVHRWGLPLAPFPGLE